MNLLFTGDWHTTGKRPENRTDNYWQTVLTKIEFLFRTAKNNCVGYILQPGDLTDTPAMTYEEFCDLVDLFERYKEITVICTIGQHDMRYRNMENTAIRALEKAVSNLIILNNNNSMELDKVRVHGCPYNQEIPTPSKGEFNILLIHKMIVDDKLWASQEGHEWGSAFLRRNKFDVVVSGDNHQFFIIESNTNKRLFNCGSLLRSTIAQIDHKPKCILHNTDKLSYKVIDVPIEPYQKVFQMDKVERERERNENLDAFIKGLSEQKEMSMNFESALDCYIKANKIDPKIRTIIEDCKHG